MASPCEPARPSSPLPAAAASGRFPAAAGPAAIALTCLAIYLAGNGRISLWDRDEPRYAQATREMLRSGDFIVPTFNAQPRFHKPILLYWLMAASYTVFGENEFAARFGSAIAGSLTCLLTYRLGCRMGGRAVGVAAGLMLAVAPLMVIESKLATPDAVLMACLTGAFGCLWELYETGPSWRYALGFWTLLGIAVLTKGPVAPAIVATALVVWLPLARAWCVLRHMQWIAGAAVFAAIVLPWGLAVYWATGGEFYREAIGKHVVGRSLEAMDNHVGFPGYYAATALVGLFPWSVALPVALAGVRRWGRAAGPGAFLLGWILGPMLLLELVRTKLPHYYLPAYPAWVLLFARGLVAAHAAGERWRASRRGRVRGIGFVAACLGVAVLAAWLAITRGPREVLAPALAAAAVLAVGTAVVAACLAQARDLAAWSVLVVTWGGLALLAGGWLLPSADRFRIEREAALRLRAHAADAALVLHTFREPSLLFYLGRPVPVLSGEAALRRYVRERGPVYTLLHPREAARLGELPGLEVEGRQRIEGLKISQTEPTSVVVVRLSRRPRRAVAAARSSTGGPQ